MALTRRRLLALLPVLARPGRLAAGPVRAVREPALVLHPELRELALGAYYFAWYRRGHPRWRPNQRLRFLPQGGAYGSDDPRTVDRHLALCERYGIDLLGVNWHNWNSLDEEALAGTFRRRVRASRIRFFVNDDLAIAFGGADRLRSVDFSRDADARRFLRRQGEHLAARYMEHPNYLYLRGRPVVELYVSRAVRRGFGGLVGSFVAGVHAVLGIEPYLLLDEIWWQRTDPRVAAAAYAEHLRYADAITAWTMASESVLARAPGRVNVRQFARMAAHEFGRHRRFRDGRARAPIVPQVTLRLDHLDPRRRLYLPPSRDALGRPQYLRDTVAAMRVTLPFVEPLHRGTGLLMLGTFNEWQEGNAIEPTRPGTIDRHGLPAHGRAILAGVRQVVQQTRRALRRRAGRTAGPAPGAAVPTNRRSARGVTVRSDVGPGRRNANRGLASDRAELARGR